MVLARGKRLVVLDKNGAPQSLSRMLKSVTDIGKIKEKISDIIKTLPTIEQGRNRQDIQRKEEIDLSNEQSRFNKRIKAVKGYDELSKTQERLLKRGRGYSL